MANFKFRIEQDVQHRLLILKLVDPATNLVVDGAPTIRLQLDALRYATPSGTDELIEAAFRRIHYQDANDGSKQRCYGLLTAPESDATDDGHSDDVEDLYLGGGGGAMLVVITHLYSLDYFGVIGFDGSDNYGEEFFVAKSFPSRMVASMAASDGTYTYTYTGDNNRTSTSPVDGSTEAQEMCPLFAVGQWTYVMPVTWSMISKDGTELKWVEMSTEREWVKKYTPKTADISMPDSA